MDRWKILDKSQNSEHYQPLICSDEISSNFSVTVSAVLENKSSDETSPKIRSHIHLPYVCIYFDNVLLILHGEKCELKLHKSFQAKIQHLLILKKNVSLIILENGAVCIVDLKSGTENVTNVIISNDKVNISFLYEQNDGDVIFVNSKGILYPHFILKFSNIGNQTKYKLVQINHNELSEDSILYMEMQFKQMKPIYKSTLCMSLSNNKNINMICPITKQSYAIEEMNNIFDFTPFVNSNNLLFLTSLDGEKYYLCITNSYDSKIKLKANVTRQCAIIGGIDNYGLYSDIKDGKVFIYFVKENSPISQLEILISLKNYEAAELFAKSHDLSPTEVLKIKAKCLLNSLKTEFSPELFKDLNNILFSCSNLEFVAECCIDGIESNIELCPLLEFAKNKLVSLQCSHLNTKLDDLIWKVEVFKLFKIENEISLEWQDFINENPISLCKKLLYNNFLDQAALIWTKSYRFIFNSLKIDDITNLLNCISLETKLNSLLRWLEYFIPNVISVLPYSIDLIINWAKERIGILENSPHWPEVGIQFAEKFANLTFNSKGLVAFIPPSADKIYLLIKSMKQIQTLKKDYNIIVSLRDFNTISPYELSKLILRKAFNEDLQMLIQNFLDNFMAHHNLNHDAIIREYIEELIGLSPAIDESKMQILVDNIYNVDEKYLCLIIILKSANVPWSTNIKSMFDNAVASKHPLIPKLYNEMLHSDIRAILMKYKCHELSSEDYDCLIRLIVEKGDADMMSDIHKITNVFCSLKEDAYLLCIQKYIKLGEIFSALNIYYTMDDNFKEICANAFLFSLEDLIKSNDLNKEFERNYIDFLKCICSPEEENTLDLLYKMHILKNSFQLHISFNEYRIKEYRKFYLSKWCKEKNHNIKMSQSELQILLSQTIKVGKNLQISKSESLLILINSVNIKLLPNLAELMMSDKHYFLDRNIYCVETIVKLMPFINLEDILFLGNALDCVLHVLKNCESKHVSFCTEVCSWLTSIHFAHSTTKELFGLWKISSFYNPHIVSSVIPIFKELLSKNQVEQFKSKNFNLCICTTSEQCNDGSVCLPTLLHSLQVQQNDIYFLRIVSYFTTWHLNKDLDLPAWLINLNDNAIKSLMLKMITFEKPDHLFISNLMFSLSSRTEWLNEVFQGHASMQKKIGFSQHILKCRSVYRNANVPYKQAFDLYSQNHIETKMENYGILLKDNQQDNMHNLITLLESVVDLKSLDIDVFQEYCSIGNINLDEALTCYLFILLKSWNNEYSFTEYNLGKCKITEVFKRNDFIHKCMKIVNRISCKNELVTNLTTLFKNGEIRISNLITVTLNSYCYEVYLFILDLLQYITESQAFLREYLLLKFLQNYQRISKPNETELDEFSLKETFPKIGFYRLPFQNFMSAYCWNNLKPEITLVTYKQWLPIAGLLLIDADVQTSRDMICSNAVRQSMTIEKTINENSIMKWSLYMKNNRLLEDANECVQNITNLEWAGACLYYVFQGSTFGADQVAAINMCYQFAEQWAKIEPNNNVLKKMQTKHLLTSSAHILRKYGLGEDKLLSLCSSPHRLIDALYNHKSIITNYEDSDINNAVDEIARKHNLNIGPIRMQILERILKLNTSQIDISNTDKLPLSNDGSLNKEMLMKACYILKGMNLTLTALYLLRIGLSTNESAENHSSPIRALQCLLSIVDIDLIEKVTKYTLKEIWSKLWEIYFVHGLHTIGSEHLLSLFYENKSQTVQQMWYSREHNFLTVSLIIKMMFIYDITLDNNALDELCKSILKFNMISHIKEFLLFSKVIYSENYVNMWSHVLLSPFKRLDTPLIGQQKDDCYEALKLLPTCPVLSQIDLSLILNTSLRLGATEMAMLTLPHLSVDHRIKARSKIGKMKKSTLQEMKLLKSRGILTTGMVMSIIKQS